MKKCLLILFLLALVWLPAGQWVVAASKSVGDFKDLQNLSSDVKSKFDHMIQEGVFNGVSDDTFGLNSPMTRAQFAKVAAIIFALPVDEKLTKSSFTDVSMQDSANSYALPYIEALKKAGLTNGYDAEGKTYLPSGTVSRQELATFLIRGLGLEKESQQATPVKDSTVDDWAKKYVALALEKKIMTNQSNGQFGGKESATRSMLVTASYEAKKLYEESSVSAPQPGNTSPTPTPAPTPAPSKEISAKGKRVLFVGREKIPAEDTAVVDRLKDLGFKVTNLADKDLTADKAKGYDLIYISQTTNSKYLKGETMKDVAIPTVYLKNHGLYYLGLSSIEEGAGVNNIKSISITDSKHKVADGLSGTVDVYKEAGDKFGIGYGLPGKEAKVIATIPGEKDKATIYYYDKGTKADNGYEVKARISYFYLSNGMHENTTDAGWKLLDNLVLWTLQNG